MHRILLVLFNLQLPPQRQQEGATSLSHTVVARWRVWHGKLPPKATQHALLPPPRPKGEKKGKNEWKEKKVVSSPYGTSSTSHGRSKDSDRLPNPIPPARRHFVLSLPYWVRPLISYLTACMAAPRDQIPARFPSTDLEITELGFNGNLDMTNPPMLAL